MSKADDRADKSEARADESEVKANKSEIRMDHFEQKSAADKFVTEQQAITLAHHVDGLVASVKDLAEGVESLHEGVESLHRATRRQNRLIAVGATLVFAFGVAFLWNFDRSFANQDTLKEQGRIIEAVTGCTTRDSKAQCQDKQEIRSVDEGLARLKAVECIGRSLKEGDPKHVVEQKCFPPPKSKPAPALPPPPKGTP